MTGDNILDRIFNAPDEDVKTFLESVSDIIKDRGGLEELVSGKTIRVMAPMLITQKSGKIQIEHGHDGDDCVWHICPVQELSDGKRTRRVTLNFKVNEERLLNAICLVMKDYIPDDCRVEIIRPYQDWDLKIYTFKAFGLNAKWNIPDRLKDKLISKLFEILNELI